jgi:hypothetical protein
VCLGRRTSPSGVRDPGRSTAAPAESTRGGPGGNEWTEALRGKAPLGGQRAVRAAARANTEHAPKPPMQGPTQENGGEGRRREGREWHRHLAALPGYWWQHAWQRVT